MAHCEPPFWMNPSILFNEFSLQYKPNCEHSVWNFVARIMILSLFVGLIASVAGGLPFILVALLFGLLTALAIVMMTPKETRREERKELEEQKIYKEVEARKELQQNMRKANEYQPLPFVAVVDPSRSSQNYATPVTEHFVNGGSQPNSVQPFSNEVQEPFGIAEVDAAAYSGPALPDYTPPTSKNLFMNVLVNEMKYNPHRPEAAPIGNPSVKQTLDDYFRVHWFSDPTDVFGKNQNQRQFITQPSTTVPNDQGSFANWLYKIPGKTCKEGGYCLAGTDGGLMPWLADSS